jgi:hypothetical protein
VRGQPSPRKGLLVHLDRGAVDFDGARDRFQRKRNGAFLEREAEHKGIGCDAVAHQGRRNARGVDDVEVFVANGIAQRVLHRLHFEIDIGIHHEAGGGLQVGVDNGKGGAAFDAA